MNTKQLGMMGATSRTWVRTRLPGKQVIKAENIPHILATMTTAGFYDGSGCMGLERWTSRQERRRRRHHCNRSGTGCNFGVLSPVGRSRQQRQGAGSDFLYHDQMNLNLYDSTPDLMK